MKTCYRCGKIIKRGTVCECKKEQEEKERQRHKEYQRKYTEENPEAVKPLKTKRWQEFRKLIIQRDGGYCQRCKVKFNLINYENLQVHHIKPRSKYPELIYDEENCITLCRLCNLQLGTDEKLDFEPDERIKEDITPKFF